MFDSSPDHFDPVSFVTGGSAAAPGRPSWSGLLQLSLVGIPLKAYPAVRSRTVPSCHQLHQGCGQRIRYAKHCPVHGDVDAAAIVRGYEYGPEQHVLVEPEELDRLRPAQDHALRLERFLAPNQLDPLLYSGRSLYLLPDGPAAEMGYQVLQSVMRQRGRWAVGRMILGGHPQVVLLRPAAALLVLQVLHYPELVKACPRTAAPAATNVGGEEQRLAGMLIDAASGAVDWNAYQDTTAQELRALVQAKLEGREAEINGPARAILPLLEALQQSVAVAGPQEQTGDQSRQRAPRKRARRTA